MQTSIFLAKIIGPVFLVVGLIVLLNPSRIRTVVREFLQGEAFIFLSGIVTLPIGLALVNTHNVWSWDWRVAITVFGWLAVFAGIARLAFGAQIKHIGAAMIDNQTALMATGILIPLFGAWLSWIGYLS